MCGIFGFILNEETDDVNIASVIYLGLIALQHRGQEGAGIVTADGKDEHFRVLRGRGLISNVFNSDEIRRLGDKARLGIGHTRYSTSGNKDTTFDDVHPFIVYSGQDTIALSHNGELVDADIKRENLIRQGEKLMTEVDSEIIARMLASTANNYIVKTDWLDVIESTVKQLNTTSFSLVIMIKDRLFAVKDPWGNRPLCLAALKFDSGTLGWAVASESSALYSIDGDVKPGDIYELKPGEIVEITSSGPGATRRVMNPTGRAAFCIFEYVYFARSSSVFEGQQVDTVRYNSGVLLAKEAKVDADVVSCVPESSFSAAMGYAVQTGLPYKNVLSKNNYIGRSFILPNTKLRQQSITKKFAPISQNIVGKRIVLVDDSIVRGNTMQQLVKMLKGSGAKEVHIRIASPPLRHPCYMGINIPTKEELIANVVDESSLAYFFGADSLVHLSVDGLKQAVQMGIDKSIPYTGHCTACFDGKYPVLPKNLQW